MHFPPPVYPIINSDNATTSLTPGAGLANKHSTILPEKQEVLLNKAKYYGTTQGMNPPENKKHEHIIINVLHKL